MICSLCSKRVLAVALVIPSVSRDGFPVQYCRKCFERAEGQYAAHYGIAARPFEAWLTEPKVRNRTALRARSRRRRHGKRWPLDRSLKDIFSAPFISNVTADAELAKAFATTWDTSLVATEEAPGELRKRDTQAGTGRYIEMSCQFDIDPAVTFRGIER